MLLSPASLLLATIAAPLPSAPVAWAPLAVQVKLRVRFLGEFGGVGPGGGSVGGRLRPRDQRPPRGRPDPTPAPRGVPGSYHGPGAGAATGPAAAGGGRAPARGGPPANAGSLTPATTGALPIELVPIDWASFWDQNRELYLQAMRRLRARLYPDTGAALTEAGELGGRPERAEVEQRVVPALLAVLEEDPPASVAAAALVALGRVGASGAGSARSLEALVAHLAHEDQLVVESACIALGVLERPEAVPTLTDLLLDARAARRRLGRTEVPVRLRAFAAYGLGLVAASDAGAALRGSIAGTLLDALEERDATRQVHAACVVALGGIGPFADDAPARRGAPRSTAEVAARLLELHRSRRAEDLLRAHAATSLASLAAYLDPGARAEVLSALAAALGERSREPNAVRESCALAAGLVGDADRDEADVLLRRALVTALEDPDLLTRYYALVSLARVAARPGPGEGEPLTATGEVRQLLLGRLGAARAPERPWVALSLGLLGNGLAEAREDPGRAVLDALRSSLAEERSPEVQAAHALALGLLRDERGRATLEATLAGTRDPGVEGACALALGMLFSPAGAEPLRALLERSVHEPYVLEDAATALGLVAYPGVVADLGRLAQENGGLLAETALSNALGNARDRRAIDPLLAKACDPDELDLVRAWALTALGELCEKGDIPFTALISTRVNTWIGPESLTDPEGIGILDLR